MDEYEESKRERERRLKMKLLNTTATPDKNPTTDSTNNGRNETITVIENRTTEVLIPSQRTKALETEPTKAELKKVRFQFCVQLSNYFHHSMLSLVHDLS